jgi:hypothetical protein
MNLFSCAGTKLGRRRSKAVAGGCAGRGEDQSKLHVFRPRRQSCHCTIEDASHLIQETRPDAAVMAVEDVLARIKR